MGWLILLHIYAIVFLSILIVAICAYKSVNRKRIRSGMIERKHPVYCEFISALLEWMDGDVSEQSCARFDKVYFDILLYAPQYCFEDVQYIKQYRERVPEATVDSDVNLRQAVERIIQSLRWDMQAADHEYRAQFDLQRLRKGSIKA